jgi:hypothetical protein
MQLDECQCQCQCQLKHSLVTLASSFKLKLAPSSIYKCCCKFTRKPYLCLKWSRSNSSAPLSPFAAQNVGSQMDWFARVRTMRCGRQAGTLVQRGNLKGLPPEDSVEVLGVVTESSGESPLGNLISWTKFRYRRRVLNQPQVGLSSSSFFRVNTLTCSHTPGRRRYVAVAHTKQSAHVSIV